MLNRTGLFAIVFFATAHSASQASGQFMMGGVVAGPMLAPPRAGSFFFGIGPPIAVPSATFPGQLPPWHGFYTLAPTRVSPAPSDRLLMPPNAEDVLRGDRAGEEPRAAARPREPAADDAELPSPRLRIANEKSMARARQFIDYGDASFRRQQFARAYDRYRKAAESAPNLAEGYFRQALAQSAIGQYVPAVKTIRRGLAIDADWPRSRFRLDHLYPNRAAKEAHFERLALTAGEEPESAELMLLLGVELYFDGQAARAATFFEEAAKLGLDEKMWRSFLDSALRRARREPGGEEL